MFMAVEKFIFAFHPFKFEMRIEVSTNIHSVFVCYLACFLISQLGIGK